MTFSSLNILSIRGCVYAHVFYIVAHAWKERAFIEEVNSRCLLLISGGHICVPKLYKNMVSPYKALQWCMKCFGEQLRNCGPNRPETCTNCLISVFCNISFSWLLPLDGFQFIFLCHGYCVTVTKRSILWFSSRIFMAEINKVKRKTMTLHWPLAPNPLSTCRTINFQIVSKSKSKSKYCYVGKIVWDITPTLR